MRGSRRHRWWLGGGALALSLAVAGTMLLRARDADATTISVTLAGIGSPRVDRQAGLPPGLAPAWTAEPPRAAGGRATHRPCASGRATPISW